MAKKKILLLSDDLRMHSGIATISRELVLGTADRFDWVQLAGAIQHPDKGKIADMSEATNKLLGRNDCYVKLYPIDGYGDEDTLFTIMNMEKPDALLHFTDPRFWTWLYLIERQVRSKIPLTYLNIWDDLPYPMYNRPFYESCDVLMSISKQTYNINKQVLGKDRVCTVNDKDITGKTLIHYVPHGINNKVFQPLPDFDPRLTQRRKEFLQGKEYDFVFLYNSRNVHRKRTSNINIVLAYRNFCDNLPKDKAKKCCLILHTEIRSDAGTDLIAVKEALCPDYDIVFSTAKIMPEDMSCLYNIADVTINVSSNEGFGLSTAESIMCGTPIIVNVSGGLQDQIGQVDDEGKPIEFNLGFGSNMMGKYKNHGVWAKPLWPTASYIQGSIPTPYIFDDLCRWEDLAEAMMYWYVMDKDKRELCGLKGREWACGEGGINADNMCKQFITAMDFAFANWKPVECIELITADDYVGNMLPENNLGIELPKIDIDKIKKDVETTLAKL
jgi:glycosyltransferase involved in cell wall biosynthesis